MDDEPKQQEMSMDGDELVTFAGIFTRSPTPEEHELILHFNANIVADDMARLENLSESEKEALYRECIEEDRLMQTATASVTEFANLHIRLVTVHYFSVMHSVNETDHRICTTTLRFIIREDNKIENFNRDSDFFDL